ncbi:hypothetical protein [Brevundimonas sp. Root1279]|uniref:hypothetical protein n=1 Tax=Brevundimonas sp. Root1279 TaxID=1736443 RepID=UPI0006F39C1D|nr:hypothetical protein [Brevundimonas sp. Root1279]KQW78701.1 hypothetical protein ASC65_15390 [Brevundimonas sp. Root1279]
MSRILPVAATAALTLALSAGSVLAQDWRALARQDLQAAHDELAANHPAPAISGAASQSFQGWLDSGLQDALSKSGQANSGSSHAYLLRYYAAGFRDSNIVARPSYDTPSSRFFAINWPGVATGWRDGKYVVTYVQQGLRNAPQIGDVVVSCNDIPIDEFARGKLDRWEGDLNTEAGRVTTAPYLLWNRNNPYAAGVPSLCEFQRGRRTREVELKPQAVDPAALEAAYRATVYTPGATQLSIETVNGRPWINVHSFADDAGWEAFNTALEGQVEAIRGPQGFVLDLRGGSGASNLGSAARGYSVLNRIWTPGFAQSRQPSGGELTYRVTPANRQWYSDVLGRMKQDARFVYEAPGVIAQTEAIVAAFDAAAAAGQTTFTSPLAPSTADASAGNPVQGPVVVLVDASCSGGCLDTVDLLTRLPNVRIAGATTAADSIFIEQTTMRLPSTYADLAYGHKAWTSRERGNNQPFTPGQGLVYTGNPVDENAVRAWVATLFGG